ESGADVRMNYYWELLRAALEETSAQWGPYTMGTSAKTISAARAEIQLSASTEISLMARTTSIEREKTLLPVLIPLDKGLTGYRLFLTSAASQPKLQGVRSLQDLQNFTIGQGATWIDSDILRSAGLRVVTGPNYDSLFAMLAAQRFDLFSRGVNEIGLEYAVGKINHPDLVIEKNLLLYYPLPRYFFFARTAEGERLAKRVEEGLRLLLKSGKFEKRYQEFKRSILMDLGLTGRKLIRIPNPYLSAATPLADLELWDNLDAELKAQAEGRSAKP
ncbi:MAG: hypothetical protein CFE44_20720, partial [Burkholderiales bacterium PBB4]